jgi:1-deoxy-D-xylulose-5-phosphate reductoisomerase
MKRIAILGSTGSIGRSALAVVAANPGRLCVAGMAAGRNGALFAEQIAQFHPRAVSMASESALADLRAALTRGAREGIDVFAHGTSGLSEVATQPDVDLVLCASSGTAALEAVLAAIECGKAIALANKEVLVMAGALVTRAARRHGVPILPVDSEHNAIHQCLHQRRPEEVRRLILTASGGPFRERSRHTLERVTPEDALSHPTWKMGRKITIDSATLMNKGLEVIEAHWLFDMAPRQIDVVIHPQSVVHSLVEMVDGSVIAQLGVTDMRLPIQYAFSYPERWEGDLPALDLSKHRVLEFHEPDHERFPCLGLAYRALAAGRSFPIVLNATNEVAVASFLEGRLRFMGIPEVIEQVLDAHDRAGAHDPADVADIRHVDRWAHARAAELVRLLESDPRVQSC